MNENIRPEKMMVDIIVIEDSSTQAEQLKYLLEKHHYSVIVANNGLQALSILDQYDPKIIITDIVMPEMDGYEFCRSVKNQNRKEEIPIILLTSLSNPEDVIEGLECGADNFITKPYSEDYLLSHVEHIIANRKLQKPNVFASGSKFCLPANAGSLQPISNKCLPCSSLPMRQQLSGTGSYSILRRNFRT